MTIFPNKNSYPPPELISVALWNTAGIEYMGTLKRKEYISTSAGDQVMQSVYDSGLAINKVPLN